MTITITIVAKCRAAVPQVFMRGPAEHPWGRFLEEQAAGGPEGGGDEAYVCMYVYVCIYIYIYMYSSSN